MSAAQPTFPTLVEAFDERPESLSFTFVPVTSSFTDAAGTTTATFWVTGDALKWEVPEARAALFAAWNQQAEPDPADAGGLKLCRLPCSATQCQEIADLVTTHPDPDASGALAGLVDHVAALRPDMGIEGSLLLTPRLYDLRWEQAGAQISPCPQDIDRPIVGESARLNRAVNQKIKAVMARDGLSAVPAIVADPGKIWAITGDVYADRVAPGTAYHYKCAVNYGWHGHGAPLLAVTPGQTVVQSVGTRHDAAHFDYSQVAVLVAGWCEVTRPGEAAPTFLRTEDVYRDPALCRLVTHDGRPLAVTRY
jgi:hypothetical protein